MWYCLSCWSDSKYLSVGFKLPGCKLLCLKCLNSLKFLLFVLWAKMFVSQVLGFDTLVFYIRGSNVWLTNSWCVIVCTCHFEVNFLLINDSLNSICLLPNFCHLKRDPIHVIQSHILPLWLYSLLQTLFFIFFFLKIFFQNFEFSFSTFCQKFCMLGCISPL